MNNNVKKLISGVLALSIVVSGNGIVGFADEVNTKSTEQAINSETTGISTNLEAAAKEESPTPSTEQEKPNEPAAIEFRPEEISKLTNEAKRAFTQEERDKLNQISGKEDNVVRRLANKVESSCCLWLESFANRKDKNSVMYKVQKVIDNLILLAGKYIIIDKVLGGLFTKCFAFSFGNVGNPFLATLLYFSSATALVIPLFPLWWPLNPYDTWKKLVASLAKLF